jgi:DNA invertase Pin-like site-specific DNA recombinase
MTMRSLAGVNVALYARYSSDLQRPASIDDQLRRCREHVERHGGSVLPELVFFDAARSGASLDPDGFERMMRAVRARRVDVIVVEDMSRVSRDLADSAQLFRELQFLGVALVGIADGVDTSGKGAKVAFTVKSLMSDLYLEELSDKTRRGLEGRALAGYSTGGLPLGYRSVPEADASGRVVGNRIVIEADCAAIVRRIFDEYRRGRSLADIARLLTTEGALPPRSKSRGRRHGWLAGTIREILRNTAYVGAWSFKKKHWRRIPGTNARRPRESQPGDVLKFDYPDRRIIDQETWDAVRSRAASVRALYTGKRSGTAPGRSTTYPLSGLLFCGHCNASMVITRGTHAAYYKCGDYKKRRTCANSLGVREDLVRKRIFEALRERLSTLNALEYLRKRIAEFLGERVRDTTRELGERRARLERTEQRIRGLVQFIADGDRSEHVLSALRDLEAQARSEKAAIASLRAESSSPVALPTPAEVAERALGLDRLFEKHPLEVREALRRYFVDGRVTLRSARTVTT